ncbi:WD40-repeat-containing domain protein [Cokeromyces recurvatus]|uniref:WD40-repeat-containing domain protein n=1 Tax=Cokeromyces recurvatus TaxID=90255 RepID=UPI00222071EA|nr:WD40-repeat-containing domain protein [Cokeromyces recurvatus]KAI7899550.1 WD40-repeat-containing domain protein [Cokeromyces recurvatus]
MTLNNSELAGEKTLTCSNNQKTPLFQEQQKISLYKALKQRSLQHHPKIFGRRCIVPARSILPFYKSRSDKVYQFIFPDNEFCTPFICEFAHRTHDGNLLAVGDEDGRISLLRTDKNNEQNNLQFHHSFYCHRHALTDVKWSPDDTMLITASTDKLIRLWDMNIQTSLAEFRGHGDIVKSVNWHPTNQNLLVSASKDGSYRIWDTRYKQRRPENPGDDKSIPIYDSIKHEPFAHSNITSPAITSSSKTTKKRTYLSSITNTRKKPTSGPQPLLIRSVTCAVFNGQHEEQVITSGSTDGAIKLWDIRIGRKPSVLASTIFSSPETGKRNGIADMKLANDGKRLFSCCMDNTVYMHYLTDLTRPAKKFRDPHYKVGGFDIRISISSDDRFLLSGSFDKDVFAWDLEDPISEREASYHFQGHQKKVIGVSWHKKNNSQFASCSEDFTTRIWQIDH